MGKPIGAGLRALAGFLGIAWVGLGCVPAIAMEYVAYELQVERQPAAVCLAFTRPLPRARQAELAPFVTVDPPTDLALTARGERLCATGLRHGGRYRLVVRKGLRAIDGTNLEKDVALDLLIPDRAPSVAFAGRGTLLPLRPGTGLPLKSVNVERARLALYRVGERNLLTQLEEGTFGQALDAWSEARIADIAGEKLFEGTVTIAGRRNEEVRTLVPLDALVPALRPGLHVAVVNASGSEPEPWEGRATQWFTVSDVALTAARGADGLTVIARSLATAEPLPDVRLQLLARNNEPLATVITDERGIARIGAAKLRGRGGNAPRLLVARHGDGDLAFLELDRPPLDLVDLGAEGRTPPGPLDAFLWTERGVYRPGETVHLGVLLRDARAEAVADLPVTLKLVRPDGVEVLRRTLPGDPLGGGTTRFEVAPDAFSGVWTVTAHAGADAPAIGSTSFVVEDFVPPRLELSLAPASPRPDPAAPIAVRIEGRYLFGAPAAGLEGEVELVVRPAGAPFPELAGFSFGLVQESFLPQAAPPVAFVADEKGLAEVELALEPAPHTTRPLEAVIRGRLLDVDGRAAQAETVVPLRPAGRMIGLRAEFAGPLPEASEATFDVALVDPEGRPFGPAELEWELLAEEHDYAWFQRGGRWEFEPVVRDSVVTGGGLRIDAAGRGRLVVPVRSGRYRIEVYDPAGTAATSLRFGVGWWAGEATSDRPEKLALSVEPGGEPGRVKVRLEPTFDARVTLLVADAAVRAVHELTVPKGGATHELEVGPIGPGGMHLLASAVSASGAVLPRLPLRAVGAAWLPGPLAERRLEIALEAPEGARPGTTLVAKMKLGIPPEEGPVRVVAAMVDDAILGLTRFVPPDPVGHYLGRRALGIELRDVYGRLIDPVGEIGRVAAGGDRRAALQLQGLDVRTFKTVATMTGPLEPGPDGSLEVSFEVPDFTGRLRLMVVAWSRARVGAAHTAVRVRPPLQAELALPRFLAPGDRAEVRLDLVLADSPPGTYEVRLETEGPLTLDRTALTFRDVVPGRRRFAPLALTAGSAPGSGRIRLLATGPEGFRLERTFELAVRAAQPWLTRRQLVVLEPGHTLGLGPALAAEFLPGTARLGVVLSTVPAIDVPGLLAELERYPYGCTEQIVSRALPLLSAARLGGVPGLARPEEAAQRAIGRLVSLESAGGGFGAWSASGERELWLTAYVQDFLDAAIAAGVPVPESLIARNRAWLAARLGGLGESPAELAAGAYAAFVLARAGGLDPSRLRYLALRAEPRLPSDAARIQLAAALQRYGERDLAGRLIAGLGAGRVTTDRVWLADYGSELRDSALVLAVGAEENLLSPGTILPLAEKVAVRAAAERWLSTQEQAWLVRAAAALQGERGTVEAMLGSENLTGRGRFLRNLPLGSSREQLELRNLAAGPLYVAIGVTGIPSAGGPAERRGFSLERRFLTPRGEPVDLGRVRQNQQLVVLLEGGVSEPGHHRALLVDLLPAGIELESVRLEGSPAIEQLQWLGELETPLFTGLRDDRFVAAFDLSPDRPQFRVAYLARAITPGSYVLPGAQVEDMYAPALFARTSTGRLVVTGR
jgi:uncharacterized protein YfaS (alpha-2-macroglobulin family)